ncbi:plasmid pRiA4b ORF-3 family protein [Nonomuraea sp. NPDC049750]|uniref:plasmid pRiA4b ORF-3 family protein n=1 Tax=Nonomuraea sp. NPDC049750 TaxID=3154738 RepID=UPI0033C526DB
MTNTPSAKQTVHTIKVTLRGSRPPVWRRLGVASDSTLRHLHDVIQASFGWQNYHMWVFDTATGRFGDTDRELEIRSAASTRLDQVAPRANDRLRYTYDFGDDWEHDILVEAITDAEPGTAYPRCLTGRRAGPPEDSGGVWGYEYLLEILADPTHDEHQERLEWLGLDSADQFNPASFDANKINDVLSGLAIVLTKD